MKKAIIILTLLTLITIGASVYEGYQYIISINEFNDTLKTKSQLIDTNINLEKEYNSLQKEYDQKAYDILNDNLSCKKWKSLEEVLKTTEE